MTTRVLEPDRHHRGPSKQSHQGMAACTAMLLLLLVIMLLPAQVQAQFIYSTENSTIYIVRYDCTGGQIEIPDTINGLPVTTIGYGAFYGCTGLTNVTIPNSVTTILDDAFRNCTGLTSATIPNGVKGIGYGAFSGCTGLTSVIIPNSVTFIPAAAFYGCTGLVSVTIPNSVTTIGDYAFSPCVSLKSVTIPNSVTTIKDHAFAGCSGLTSVTLPRSVTTIWPNAFSACTGLMSVYFLGNTPVTLGDIFSQAGAVTVYYLAATTGWGPRYSSRPTAVFSPPLIHSNGPGFGASAEGFGFLISWAPTASVVVDAATSLTNPVWSPVSTNMLSGGVAQFRDPQWTNSPARFYRVRSP